MVEAHPDMIPKSKKDSLYYATGFTTLAAFLLVILAMLFHAIPEANREIFIHVLGIIEGAFVGNMVNYFFGGSMVSDDKKDQQS
jgi:hypothetical protein